MFKAPLYFLLFLLLPYSLSGQVNLVPNPSFEIYDTCPDINGCSINDAVNWTSASLSPDYYNSCASIPSGCSVPDNIIHRPAASGNAYVGFYSYSRNNCPPNTREYLSTQLTSPLTIGTKYYVSLKVNLVITGSFNCATNNIGALFSTTGVIPASPSPLTNNFAHIISNNLVTDTSSWTKIEGSFIADSAYQYVFLGNFYSDPSTDTFVFFSINNDSLCNSYYFIDDVCVSTDSSFCGITGIKNSTVNESVLIFPNPFSSRTTVIINSNTKLDIIAVELFDLNGRKQFCRIGISASDSHAKLFIDRDLLPSGIYYLRITLNDHYLIQKLIIN